MTATSNRSLLDTTSHRHPSVHRSRDKQLNVSLAAAIIGLCEVAGVAAIVHAYNIAEFTTTSTSEFAWFWAGMFLLEIPLASVVALRRTPQSMRTALLLIYGFVSYIPKLLRNPSSPLYHDEYAHWRATYEIVNTGKLFQPNPMVPIIARYPGLHAATAALVNATGLTIWQAATLLLIFFHLALVLGLAALSQSLGLSNRTASLIAILYGLNSSFLYFDTQYAYESMAITLVVWALVTYVRALRSPSREGRLEWGGLTLMLAAGTVITHHLSTFTLVIIMALISLSVSIPALVGREGWARATAMTAWSLTLVTVLMASAWFSFVAPSTWSYLSPYFGKGFSELMQAVGGAGGSRQLFGASLSPWWEQKSAYLVTFFALGLAVGGLLLIRTVMKSGRLPPGRRRAFLFAFSFFGLVYFPSTVFILSPDGAEGARRSWAFTWIGFSILAGLTAVWLLDWTGRHADKWKRISLRLGLAVILAIALVGGTAAGLDASYRLPGPFLYGSDTRSVTPELLAASEWFAARFGTNNNVITDRYTGLIFGSYGLQNTVYPSGALPFYSLYLGKPGAPIQPPSLIPELSFSHITYLIVDERMAYDLPELGVYFTSADPSSLRPQNGRSALYGKLNKFNTIQWMVKVYQSEDYSIYRLNLPVTLIGYQRQPPARGENLSRGKLTVSP